VFVGFVAEIAEIIQSFDGIIIRAAGHMKHARAIKQHGRHIEVVVLIECLSRRV